MRVTSMNTKILYEPMKTSKVEREQRKTESGYERKISNLGKLYKSDVVRKWKETKTNIDHQLNDENTHPSAYTYIFIYYIGACSSGSMKICSNNIRQLQNDLINEL